MYQYVKSAYLDILGRALKCRGYLRKQHFSHFAYVDREFSTEPISPIQKAQSINNSRYNPPSQFEEILSSSW